MSWTDLFHVNHIYIYIDIDIYIRRVWNISVNEEQLGSCECFCQGCKDDDLHRTFEMVSSPDTLRLLLVEIAFIAWNLTSESTIFKMLSTIAKFQPTGF